MLSLRDLSSRPLTRRGAFSILSDHAVKSTVDVRVTFDLDGSIFASRYLHYKTHIR